MPSWSDLLAVKDALISSHVSALLIRCMMISVLIEQLVRDDFLFGLDIYILHPSKAKAMEHAEGRISSAEEKITYLNTALLVAKGQTETR
jgi:hypothetical protein